MPASFPTSVKTFTTLLDNIDDILAAHQNERGDEITAIETELLKTLLASYAANRVTLSTDKVLVDGDKPIQSYDSAADRNITLPAAGASNHLFVIYNRSTGGIFTLKDSGSNVLTTILPGQNTMVVPDSSGWIVSGTSEQPSWNLTGETFTYASASGQMFTATTPGDKRLKYEPGQRFACDQTQALTSYWNLDANSNDGIGANNGVDTAISYSAAKFSNGAVFNGTTSKIVIADASSMKPTGAFTVGFWMKSANTGASQIVFASYSASPNAAGVFIGTYVGGFPWVIIGKNTGLTLGVDYYQIVGTANICDNAFHYVVVSYANNYMQIYVDGKLSAAGFSSAPAYSGTNNVRLGCRNNTGTDINFFTGTLDDVFLINGYALDEATIRAKYLAQTAQGTGSLTLTKMFIINAIDYSAPNTTLYLHGGTDYSLANAAISNAKYSRQQAPQSFPMNPDKWSILFQTWATDSKTTSAAWTAFTGMSAAVSIGAWYLEAIARIGFTVSVSGSCGGRVTLSTTGTSETHPELTMVVLANPATSSEIPYQMRGQILLNAATTFYLTYYAGVANFSAASVAGSMPYTFRARNAYL